MEFTEYRKYHHIDIFGGSIEHFIDEKFLCRNNYKYICRTEQIPLCQTEELIYSLTTADHNLLQPVVTGNKNCTLLYLSNLAQPYWISINCNDKLINHVICFSKRQNGSLESKMTGDLSQVCERSAILFNGSCFYFHQYDFILYNELPKYVFENFKILCDTSKAKQLFAVILEAITLKEISFSLINKTQKKIKFYHRQRHTDYWMDRIQVKESIYVPKVNTYSPYQSEKVEVPIYREIIYQYHNDMYSSVKFVCGRIKNKQNLMVHSSFFSICNNSALYYRSIDGKWIPYSKQNTQVSKVINQILFQCMNNISIDEDLKDDLVSDCGIPAHDEPLQHDSF